MDEKDSKNIDAASAWSYVVADTARIVKLLGSVLSIGGLLFIVARYPDSVRNQFAERERIDNEIRKELIGIRSEIELLNLWKVQHMKDSDFRDGKMVGELQRLNQCCPYYKGK